MVSSFTAPNKKASNHTWTKFYICTAACKLNMSHTDETRKYTKDSRYEDCWLQGQSTVASDNQRRLWRELSNRFLESLEELKRFHIKILQYRPTSGWIGWYMIHICFGFSKKYLFLYGTGKSSMSILQKEKRETYL